MPAPLLAPSLLAGNHARLAESVAQVEAAGAQWLHLDLMDGHFVPNLTFGPQTLADLRKGSSLFFDTHLMLSQPGRYLEAFVAAGANLVTVHVEAEGDLAAMFAELRARQVGVGLALRPGTPAEAVRPWLAAVDLILVMTVEPGFGGQAFRGDMLPKLATIHGWRKELGLAFRLETDGGINLDTARQVAAVGCDTFVAGSAFFRAADRVAFRQAIEALPVPAAT